MRRGVLMSWHYQIRKRIIDGQKVFDIVERYGKDMWTVRGMNPTGESKAEVIRDAERMLADAKKYPVLYDKQVLGNGEKV